MEREGGGRRERRKDRGREGRRRGEEERDKGREGRRRGEQREIEEGRGRRREEGGRRRGEGGSEKKRGRSTLVVVVCSMKSCPWGSLQSQVHPIVSSRRHNAMLFG